MTTNKLLTLLLGLLIISACAAPADYRSSPWANSGKHFVVEPISPGLYQMDQFVTTYEGLSQMLRQQIAVGQQPHIIIKTGVVGNFDEEIKLAQLGESLQINVYSSSLLGISKTSSENLQVQATQAAQEAAEDEADETEYLFNTDD